MSTLAERREAMVAQQIVGRGVRDERVLSAMRTVPRELFVPATLREFAYEDTPLPIEAGQTISQPYIVALMAEALELQPGDRVLEVGAGSGYAAAVLGAVAAEIYTIERHQELAELARERLAFLGYDTIEVLHGDGTEGWRDRAPFDAIVVAAGGPEVPRSLLDQLTIGGRLVIPVGDSPRTQELLRVRRVGQHEFDRESLGKVQFVPLIGTEGWAADGTAHVSARREPGPLRIEGAERQQLAHLAAKHCEPFEDIEHASLDKLLARIGDSRVVLIGEATHGTSEFYRMRARITRELILHRGFNVVAIEADWPDGRAVDRHVRHQSGTRLRGPAFSRFPTWMWRNRETRQFVDWLSAHNHEVGSPADQVSMHGLDLYSLHSSIGVVLDYLDRVDPVAAETARVRYGCFSPWESDPATYGRAAVSGAIAKCEDEVVDTLVSLLRKRIDYSRQDGEDFFDAERNAAVVRDAERYYRVMYAGSRESWNLRDQHMFSTLRAVIEHRGQGSRAVVWAHNSHVGNAIATEMGARGELSLGQLARETYDEAAYLIGFGTHQGTVAAASNWDEAVEFMRVRPSHADSYERICHTSAVPRFLLPLRSADRELREGLGMPHLERAIGVIYRPDTEIVSHYFHASLPMQFDEYIWFDETEALHPLEAHEVAGVPETYPFGL